MHVGALQDRYLDRGRPLGEARLLHEIGLHGIEMRALRDRLHLDSGYVARLTHSLEEQGLLELKPDEQDRRRRILRLTAGGRAELAAYEAMSDQLAERLLDKLEPEAGRRLVAAMSEVERLLRASRVELRFDSPRSEAGRRCLNQYFAELAERFESGFEANRSLPADPADFAPPAGWFVIASLDGEAVGCGGLKVADHHTGEIKRMWTATGARRLGVARRVLGALESKARDARLDRLRLETNHSLAEAQALYRSAGFEEVEPFNDEPYAHHWYEKTL